MHDDLSRMASVNCGAAWSQTFGYDPFGNITKSGSLNFLPTYSTVTNQINGGVSASYDNNGNLLTLNSDANYSYSWDAEGRPVSITASGTTVGLTYDALGRMVEQNRSGSYTQVVYGPDGGKLALMSGSTLQKAFVPLPAGATAVYAGATPGGPPGYVYCATENGYCAFNGTSQVAYGANGTFVYQTLSNGTPCNNTVFGDPLYGTVKACYLPGPILAYYRHADWLGTSRLASTTGRGIYYDGAYAPFGESYAETERRDRSFTGQNQDTVSITGGGLHDFMFREFHAVGGRWISPDPAGLGAVDLTNPQSLNRYAYVTNNPLAHMDPLGMNEADPGSGTVCRIEGWFEVPCSMAFGPGGGGGGGGGSWGMPCPNNNCDPVHTDQGWQFFNYWADGSYGYSPMGLEGYSAADIASLRLDPHSDCSYTGYRRIVYEVNGASGADPGGWWVTEHQDPAYWAPPSGASTGTATGQFDDTIFGTKIENSIQKFTISLLNPTKHPNAPSIPILVRLQIEPNQTRDYGALGIWHGGTRGKTYIQGNSEGWTECRSDYR